MALLAASRQLGSAFGKQLKAMSTLHHYSAASALKTVQRTASGLRYYSHPPQTDVEPFGSDLAETQSASKSKQKSLKYQKKLHNRVFTDQELADNKMFRNHTFVSENQEDNFGNLPQRREAREASDHSPRTNQDNSFHGTLDTDLSDTKMKTEQKKPQSESPYNGVSNPSAKISRSFPQRGRGKKQSWNDEFGTLSEDSLADRIEESLSTRVGSHEERFSDDEDEEESMRIRLSTRNRRRIPEWYGRKILKLGKRGQVRDAIEVFEDWMLKQDRVMPNSYVFTCLLTVLGRAGYTKKAFSLFHKMKSMGIQPKPATYTALFNACANSPWKSDGQTRADNLIRQMKDKDVRPTFITGKAMVKAFALCGDLRQAFSLVDELSQVYRPDPEIFSFLLMACISDKKEGFRHAVQVWRVMRQMGVQPDRPLYNLLLRCVKDCGVGDTSSFTSLLSGTATTSHLDAGSPQQMTAIPSGARADSVEIPAVELEAEFSTPSVGCEQSSHESEALDTERQEQPTENSSELRSLEVQEHVDSGHTVQSVPSTSALTVHSSVTIPDILAPTQLDSRVVSLGDLSTKENRLLLLGGVKGFLSRMKKDRAAPDVITFTQLISVATPTVEAEQRLLNTMRSKGVKPDIDLVNALMHKRCMRADFAAARGLSELMMKYRLTANQMTFGILAMTCKTREDAEQLLQDMEAADMAPNMEILGTLMYASGMKFGYKLWVLRQAQKLDIVPNTKFLHNVETGLALVRQKILSAEKQGQTDSHLLSPVFQQTVETFTHHYEAWLKQTQVQTPRHPWANFRPPSTDQKGATSA